MKKLIIVVISLFFFPYVSFAAITYPDQGVLGIAAGTGSASTATITGVTFSAGVDKVLLSVIGRATISGCTVNSVSSTLIQAATIQYGYNYHSDYYLDNPTNGDIVCTYSGANAFRDIVYTSVKGSAPGIGASVTPATGHTDGSIISTSITTTALNSDIIESNYSNNNLVTDTLGTGQSFIVNNSVTGGLSTWAGIDKRSVTTATSYTVSIDPDMTPNQDVIVYEVKAAVATKTLWWNWDF